MDGFHELIPLDLIPMFSPAELELLMYHLSLGFLVFVHASLVLDVCWLMICNTIIQVWASQFRP